MTAKLYLVDERTDHAKRLHDLSKFPVYSYPKTREARFVFTCTSPGGEKLNTTDEATVMKRVRRAVTQLIEGRRNGKTYTSFHSVKHYLDTVNKDDGRVVLVVRLENVQGPNIEARQLYMDLTTTCDLVWEEIGFLMKHPDNRYRGALLREVKIASRWDKRREHYIPARETATEFEWTISCVLPMSPEQRMLLNRVLER